MDISLHIASSLDEIRKRYLRFFLKVPLLKTWYLDRRLRLLGNFIAGGTVSLVLAAAFPLWVLAIGPVLFGLPHLIASFRYTSPRPSFVTTALILSAIVGVVRLLRLPLGNEVELAAALVLLLTSFAFIRLGSVALVLVPLLFCSWRFPFQTVGLLILAHNFIAFLYWYRSARARQDQIVVAAALALFSLVTALIFAGAFDFLYFRFSADGEAWGMKVWEIGSLVLPGTISYPLLARATIAYAFGQSIHYFIWLRAIPEQQLPYPTPTSFRQSLFYLRRDLGPKLARVCLILVISLSSVWILSEFSWARFAYLCIAAFHGYAEIVGLGLKGSPA